jgi:hypothetical protein
MATSMNAPGGRAVQIPSGFNRLSLDVGLIDSESINDAMPQAGLPPTAGMTAREAATLVPQAALDRVYPGSGTLVNQERWADPGIQHRDNLTPEGFLQSLQQVLPRLARLATELATPEQAAPVRIAGRVLDAHIRQCELSASNRLALIAG